MKGIKKLGKLLLVIMLCCTSIALSGCSSDNNNTNNNGEMSFTYSVSTGDTIEIAVDSKIKKLNSKEDNLLLKQYNGTETNIVYKSKENKVISNCNFILKDQYDLVVSRINDESNTNIKLINKGKRKNSTENFKWYEYSDDTRSGSTSNTYVLENSNNNLKINYIVWLNNSNTGVLISSAKSQKEAEFIFKHLKLRLSK